MLPQGLLAHVNHSHCHCLENLLPEKVACVALGRFHHVLAYPGIPAQSRGGSMEKGGLDNICADGKPRLPNHRSRTG